QQNPDPRARPAAHDHPRGPLPLALLRLRAAAGQDRGRASGSDRSRAVRSVSPGQADAAVVRRHLLALDGAVQRLRHHAGRPLSALAADSDTQWAVERGLQLCAQNALDVATHLAASAGRDPPDYASAVDDLGERLAGPVPLRDGLPQALALGLDVFQQRLLVDPRAPTVLHEHLTVHDDGLDVAPAAALDDRLDRIVHRAVVQVTQVDDDDV